MKAAADRVRRATALLARETAWAVRRVVRRPLATTVAALTVAVALAPSLVFQLVSRAVLPPLPFERPQDLVRVMQPYVGTRVATSYPKLRYLAGQSRTMDVAFETGAQLTLEHGGHSLQLMAMAVTPNFFSVLGARPFVGRAFRNDENEGVLSHPVVVLSEGLWRSQFGGRADVLGETVTLSGVPFSIIGVMPKEFRIAWWDSAGITTDAWVPAMMAPLGKTAKGWFRTPVVIENPRAITWDGLGRLRLGFDLRAARAELAAIGAQVEKQWPWSDVDAGRSFPFDVTPLSEDSVDPKVLHAVSLLRVAGGLVLTLGGLNLASLFLASGLERAKSLGLHATFGAPRLALVWGALSEALLVGVLGGLGAVLLTHGTLTLLGIAEPSVLTAPFGTTFDPTGWRLDWTLVVTAVLVSAAVAVAFSVAPTLRTTRADTAGFLHTGAGITAGGLRRLGLTRPGGLLVAFEMALALALIAPALLLVRSLGSLVTADLGFRPQGVATAPLHLPAARYPESATAAFVAGAIERLAHTPGIEAASWTSCLPVDCAFFTSAMSLAGSRDTGVIASVHVVAPEAFRTLGIPLLQGRDFGAEDRPSGPAVVILSEHAAKALGGAATGARVAVLATGVPSADVIGIVGDVPYGDLAREPLPAVYLTLAQRPQAEGFLIARSSAPSPTPLAGPFQRGVETLDPRLETLTVSSLESRVDANVARFRGAAWLLGAAALLALLLSGVGVYGVLSSLVARSVPEIGTRMALGASPRAIRRSIGRTALGLAAVGGAAGAALGMYGATYLRSYLYGVRPSDAPTFILTLTIAAALAVTAALAPARRASRVDPMVVLRCE